MAQWFTGQTAFRRPQFGSSNPCSRFTVTCNSSSRDPLPSDGLCGHRTDLRADTYIHTEFNAKHKMEIQKNEGWRESLLRGRPARGRRPAAFLRARPVPLALPCHRENQEAAVSLQFLLPW